MNPFLSFLILVPLLVSLIIILGLVVSLLQEGLRFDIAVGVVVMGPITTYLMLLFTKTLYQKNAQLDISRGESLSKSARWSLTNLHLAITYGVLAVGAVLLFNYEATRGLLGILGFLMGATLLWSGIIVRRSSRSITDSPYFRMNRGFYPRNPSLFFILAGSIGLTIVLLYRLVPTWRRISALDIAGVLFLLACSCVWLFLGDRKQVQENDKPM